MRRWDDPQVLWPSTIGALAHSYVLVADTDVRRTAACIMESARSLGAGVVIARDCDDAVSLMQTFGPPRLLITDLTLPGKDGFAVIEALLRVDSGRSAIIAWAATRGLREFATHRLTGARVKVLGGAAGPAVLRNAFEWVQRTAPATGRAASQLAPAVEELPDRMTELADGARQICAAAGVAVYFKAPGDAQFRVTVSWTSELPMPPSPDLLPHVFEKILKSGEAVAWPDLTREPDAANSQSGFQDRVRGLAAVPVTDEDGDTVGAIFVFDVKPLVLNADELTRLKALGRGRLAAPPIALITPDQAPPPPSVEPVVDEASAATRTSRDSSPELLDRRDATLAFTRELARVRREQLSLSVVLFDVSPLGPSSGGAARDSSHDTVIDVSETLARATRGSDLAVQWDRERPLVVLTGLSEKTARHVAERLRAALQAGARNRVAVSGGVAELVTGDTFEDVVARAHEKLQAARARGENRIA